MRSVDDWNLEGAHKSDAWGRGRQEKDVLPTCATSYMTPHYTAVSSNLHFSRIASWELRSHEMGTLVLTDVRLEPKRCAEPPPPELRLLRAYCKFTLIT